MSKEVEERYTVIKHSRLSGRQRRMLDVVLHLHKIPTEDCIVCESDWEMFPDVVKLVLGEEDD